jgi:uncharacterized protein DUF2721
LFLFSQAIAPTFFLGAVTAFVSLMASRLPAVVARLQTLNAITDEEHLRIHLKRLRRRARFLNSGILTSLRGGLCATLLLAILFVSEFFGLKYAYGAGLLFVISTFLLGFALFRFAQEASISLSEARRIPVDRQLPNQSRYIAEDEILRPVGPRGLGNETHREARWVAISGSIRRQTACSD